jgi:hypothetical protein
MGEGVVDPEKMTAKNGGPLHYIYSLEVYSASIKQLFLLIPDSIATHHHCCHKLNHLEKESTQRLEFLNKHLKRSKNKKHG